MPLAHPDAAKLLRVGNQVMIESGIDSVMISQLNNQTAAAKIEQIDQVWAERRDTIALAVCRREVRKAHHNKIMRRTA